MQSYRFAVAYITIFIIIAHLLVGEPYLWYRNSISQLAGQAYPYAWIMRLGFIGYPDCRYQPHTGGGSLPVP